mmetsp:Transcript_17960/g.46052  ORF Transcript_17960/g.46052 Transcript_17960/m.46052 type:complete len:386 (-) Transcript_17960:7-1164(-)
MHRPILLQGHRLLDRPVRRQEVELLLAVVALVGCVHIADGRDHHAAAVGAPRKRRRGAPEKVAPGQSLRRLGPALRQRCGAEDGDARRRALDLGHIGGDHRPGAGGHLEASHPLQVQLLGDASLRVVHAVAVDGVGHEVVHHGLVVREVQVGRRLLGGALLVQLDGHLPAADHPRLEVLGGVALLLVGPRQRDEVRRLGGQRDGHHARHSDAADLLLGCRVVYDHGPLVHHRQQPSVARQGCGGARDLVEAAVALREAVAGVGVADDAAGPAGQQLHRRQRRFGRHPVTRSADSTGGDTSDLPSSKNGRSSGTLSPSLLPVAVSVPARTVPGRLRSAEGNSTALLRAAAAPRFVPVVRIVSAPPPEYRTARVAAATTSATTMENC